MCRSLILIFTRSNHFLVIFVKHQPLFGDTSNLSISILTIPTTFLPEKNHLLFLGMGSRSSGLAFLSYSARCSSRLPLHPLGQLEWTPALPAFRGLTKEARRQSLLKPHLKFFFIFIHHFSIQIPREPT